MKNPFQKYHKGLFVEFGGKQYPVEAHYTPNVSFSGMTKKGWMMHMTVSSHFRNTVNWAKKASSGISVPLWVGREPGEIALFQDSKNTKFWHGGVIHNPSTRFKKIASKTAGKYDNPNLYLDGVECVGGLDVDNSGKVEADEIHLTEWQYACLEWYAHFHAEKFGYKLNKDSIIIHQDVASYKPDLSLAHEELMFRLFKKKDEDKEATEELRKKLLEQKKNILLKIIALLLARKKK